jgi:alkanesulfonate monooxygenase SsuD/methylene tetrahydromethanopterin reductase-like flavin-dependent oxidoreductase (luciferase family)
MPAVDGRYPQVSGLCFTYDISAPAGSRVRSAVRQAVDGSCTGAAVDLTTASTYKIAEQPVPLQRPHPPFLIGGGGRRTLSLAGTEADIVGLAPRILPNGALDAKSLTLAATREKIGWVQQAAGERFPYLELNIYPTSVWPVTITNDLRGEARRVVDALRSRTGAELTEEDIIDSPHLFLGSLDRLVEKFLHLRAELGISSIMLGEIGELTEVVERLADA